MMKSIMSALGLLFFSPYVFAFTCYMTLVKDTCWTQYNVTVEVYDAANNQQKSTIIIPAKSTWARQKFECQPGEKLRFQAKFTPIFWQQDEGKVYPGVSFWSLPDAVQSGDTAWNITLCFPREFAEVPMPPTATANCQCDTSKVPPIQP